MSTSICQGLQSCLEPGLVEPRVLRLKLALPNSNLSRSSPWNSKPNNNYKPQAEEEQDQDHQENDNTNEFHEVKKKIKKGVDDDTKNGLSFLQALTEKNDTETENVYVHPMVKRSASLLSAKSLEMCTESLGSETGSDTGDNSSGDEMSLLPSSVAAAAAEEERQSPRAREVIRSLKRLNRNGRFPPPLTSVSGSAGFQVRPHREDGRLVLKAVAVVSSSALFHAERADGRLTLRLMKSFTPKNEEQEEEGEEEEEVENEIESESEEEETEEVNWGENGGEEMGAEKIQRPSRCKEDGHGNSNVLMNWEPFLVAT